MTTEGIDPDPTRPLETGATAPLPGVARVNLLPAEVVRERRRRRIAAICVAVLVLYLGGLGVLYVLKSNDVDLARQERDDTEAQVGVLQAELRSLAPFQQLLDDIGSREALLVAAMSDQVSWGRVFGEMALTFSGDASLVEVQAVTTVADADTTGSTPAPGGDTPAPSGTTPAPTNTSTTSDTGTTPDAATEPAPGGEAVPEAAEEPAGDAPVGQITVTGYTVDRVAPGVRDVLVNFAETHGFFDSYLVTTVEEERGGQEVTTFEARVDLTDEVYSRRYVDGLPQETLQ